MRVGQKVFRMDLQPTHTRAGSRHFEDVRKPEADARSIRQRRRFRRHDRVTPSAAVLFRSLTSADNALAVACWNVNPRLWIGIELGCAAARIVAS